MINIIQVLDFITLMLPKESYCKGLWYHIWWYVEVTFKPEVWIASNGRPRKHVLEVNHGHPMPLDKG
jgi:hypothetical protein